MSGQGLISASFEEGRVSWTKERQRVFQAERRDWEKPWSHTKLAAH